MEWDREVFELHGMYNRICIQDFQLLLRPTCTTMYPDEEA